MCCTTLLQHTALLYSPNVFSHLVFIVEPKKRLVKKAAWTNGEEYWILTVSTGSHWTGVAVKHQQEEKVLLQLTLPPLIRNT